MESADVQEVPAPAVAGPVSEVTVTLLTGESFTFDVEPGACVGDLKRKLEEARPIVSGHYHFCNTGAVLLNQDPIETSNFVAVVGVASVEHWDRDLSNDSLKFSHEDRRTKRPGNQSREPAALVKAGSEPLIFQVIDLPQCNNALSIGFGPHPGTQKEGTDFSNEGKAGLYFNCRARCVTGISDACPFPENGDIFRMNCDEENQVGSISLFRGDSQVFSISFALPKRGSEGYAFGAALSNDAVLHIISSVDDPCDDVVPAPGK